MGIYDTYHERNGNIVRYVGYSEDSEMYKFWVKEAKKRKDKK